jgi:MraZ protein
MPSSKTPYGWMALGCLLCLLGFGLACKMRDGSQARAQADPPSTKVEPPTSKVDQSIPVVPLPETDSSKQATPTTERLAPATPADSPSESTGPPSMIGGPPPRNLQASPAPPTMPTMKIPTPTPSLSSPGWEAVVPAAFQENPPLAGGPAQDPNKGSVEPPPASVVGSKPDVPMAGSSPFPLPPIADGPPRRLPETLPSTQKNAETPPVNVTVPAVGLTVVTPVRAEAHSDPGEPPLAPSPGPVQMYQVRMAQETLRDIAKRTLGDSDRWREIYNLNPSLKPEVALISGAFVRLPSDACVPPEEVCDVKPLPLLGADSGPAKPKIVLPLTGTYPGNLDDKRLIALPRAMRDQLGEGDVVLVSPGPDHCLWVTNHEHLERLAKRLETSPAREHEVRSFRRLYFAQTEKVALSAEGRIVIPERLAQFAGLHQEVVLIGIDDHFELWDVARWRQYTQTKSAAARSAMSDD